MKKLFSLLVLCVAAGSLFAQVSNFEGTVTYSSNIAGTSMTSVVKSYYSLVTVNTATTKTVTQITAIKGGGTMIVEAGANKYYMPYTKTEIVQKQNAGGTHTIQYGTETKTIAGHLCKKATVTVNGHVLVYWLASDINTGTPYIKNYIELVGFPLEFDYYNTAGTLITFTATNISTATVADSVFTISTTGYTLKSYDELEVINGGM